jgi:hypothetical protein
MGERNSVYVFKGPTIDEFRDSMVSVVKRLGGHIDWDAHPAPMKAKLLTSHNANIHAAYIHRKGYEVARGIGTELKIPWINIRIQEGSLWDYSLFEADSLADVFSTLPEYWDRDPEWLATQRGNPDLLARCWGIDRSRIENYLKSWGFELDEEEGIFNTLLRGKAYPTDRHEYGDIWQMTDFLKALGAHDPNFDEPHCIPRGLEINARS